MTQKHSYVGTGIGTQRTIAWFGGVFSDMSHTIDQVIVSFEQKYSRFREDSLLYHYNKTQILPDDEDFLKMFSLGEEYRKMTGGYFSLRVGGYLQELGYGKNDVVGGRAKSTSLQLDLGGIGKGYLIAKIAEYFQSQGISRYMINGGGDIYVSQENLEDFGSVGLQHPTESEQIFGSLDMLHGALAGSGTQHRKRTTEEGSQHHLIDPMTGKPVDRGILSVFVRHADIIVADIMATALFVMPIELIESSAQRVGVDFCIVFDDLSSVMSKGFE